MNIVASENISASEDEQKEEGRKKERDGGDKSSKRYIKAFQLGNNMMR